MNVNVILLIIIVHLRKEAEQVKMTDYCKHLERNLPCDSGCTKNARCGEAKEKYAQINNEERNIIVETINKMREEVASGKHPRKYPSAANMNTISYDKECEFMALCYCHICRFTTQIILVSLKGTIMGFSGYGVETFHKPSYKIDKDEIIKILSGWYLQYNHAPEFELWNSKKYLQYNTNRSRKLVIYDFMQLIWAETKYVGCSKFVYRQQVNTVYAFACVFNPSGNINNQVAYVAGPPKSRCSTNESEPNWPSLCGNMRNLSDDKYTPPIISKARFSSSKVSFITFVLCLLVSNVF